MGKNEDEQGHLFLRLDPPFCKVELIDAKYQVKPGYEDPVIRKGNKLMFMTNSLNRHERITDNISRSRRNNQKT